MKKALEFFLSTAWGLVPAIIAIDTFLFIFLDRTLLDWTGQRIAMALVWCAVGVIAIAHRHDCDPVLDKP